MTLKPYKCILFYSITECYKNFFLCLQIDLAIYKVRRQRDGPTNMTLKDFIDFFEENAEVPGEDEPEKPFVLKYQSHTKKGKPDPQKYDRDTFLFCCVMSTRRLLSNALNSNTIQADSTYKLMWEGYPLHVFGTTDHQRTFHIIAFAFSTKEDSGVFEFCFQAIKDKTKEIFDKDTNVEYLISDAAGAIKNGFRKVWPNAKLITCYFHVMKNVKEFKFDSMENREIIQKHIRQLYYSPSTEHFDAGCQLFLKECKKIKESKFATYFEKTWLSDKNKNWYHGFVNFVPKTNNAIESTNRRIKDDFDFRVKQPLSSFKTIIKNVLKTYSLEYTDGTRSFKKELNISQAQYAKADEWASTERMCIVVKTNYSTRYYLPSGTESKLDKGILNLYKSKNYKTPRKFEENVRSVWVVEISNNEDMQNITCTCPDFYDKYSCKHCIGMSQRLHIGDVPSNAVYVEKKRKVGRPKKTGPALSRE